MEQLYSREMKKRTAYAAGMRGRQEGARKRRAFTRATGIPAARYYGPIGRGPSQQITADNHYFDSERTVTNIAANATDWTFSEYDPNTTAMLCLFAPVIGDDITNRTGRRIFVKKIRISGFINIPAESAQTLGSEACNIRLILYQDKQTNGAQAQGEDVISSGAANGATQMFQNLANLGRFRVWKEKRWNIGGLTLSGLSTAYVANGQVRSFKMSIRPNCYVNYNATNGGTVADVVDNSFHIIAITNSATGMTPSIQYKVRTVFTP